MTQDEIIAMAREAGLPVDDSLGFPLAHLNESTIFAFNLWIERFAALVAAHEREACAKLCEEEHDKSKFGVNGMHCAAAIRARGEK